MNKEELKININGLEFSLKLINAKLTKWGFYYLDYEIYFNNKLKGIITISDSSLKFKELIISQLKEKRYIKGILTKDINKRILKIIQIKKEVLK